MHKLGQNTCRLSYVLPQFLFTIGKMELNYYHQKANGRAAERLKTQDLREFQVNH